MHHPDRVAGMDPEAREYSEERMKEINAAYDELRRRGT
jgi:DnaJ-class molecular chaperone